MRYLYYGTLSFFLFCSLGNYAAAASDKYVDFSCQPQEDGRIYCVNESGEPLSGKVARYNADGIVASIENYNKGYLSGLSTYFNAEGKRTKRLYYDRGVINGMYREYHANQTIKVAANYKKGIIDGRVEYYTEDGKLAGRINYKKGYLESGYCGSGKNRQNLSPEKIAKQKFNTFVSCSRL